MGTTMRNLGSTIKEAKQEMAQEDEENDFSQEVPETEEVSQVVDEEEEDVIDIDNPDELAAKGLKRIQIEGEDEEYLMDMEGNIYDLRGNFIGTTDENNNEEQEEDLENSGCLWKLN